MSRADRDAPIPLARAAERFRREAVRGVCDTGRYRCRYAAWGEGPPVLFVHGLADEGASFLLLGAHLADRFRCITYDLPTGRGDGARLGRYRHADLAADALVLLDHLDARVSYVFGSSFGSTVALELLSAAPERLPRAVLQGGFAHRPLAPAEVLLASLARSWPGRMGSLPARDTLIRRRHHAPFVGRPPDVWDFFRARWDAAPIAAVAHRALLLHRTDLRPKLSRIRQPVLLVCGDQDPLVGPACEEDLLRGLPNAVRVRLAGCGHAPQYTHPAETAQVVSSFLTPPACPWAEGDCPHGTKF